MPDTWHIGIDEAGYGPNLGPLVMTVVACRAPAWDLWELLKGALRRHSEDDDGRPVVADSKLVHIAGTGLKPLENSVALLLHLAGFGIDSAATLACLLDKIAKAYLPELRQECWFHGDTSLPIE